MCLRGHREPALTNDSLTRKMEDNRRFGGVGGQGAGEREQGTG